MFHLKIPEIFNVVPSAYYYYFSVSNNYSEKPLFMEDGMTKYAVVGSFGDLYTINIRPKESMSMKFKVSEKKSFDYLKESGHGNHNSLQASCTKLCTFHGLRTSGKWLVIIIILIYMANYELYLIRVCYSLFC